MSPRRFRRHQRYLPGAWHLDDLNQVRRRTRARQRVHRARQQAVGNKTVEAADDDGKSRPAADNWPSHTRDIVHFPVNAGLLFSRNARVPRVPTVVSALCAIPGAPRGHATGPTTPRCDPTTWSTLTSIFFADDSTLLSQSLEAAVERWQSSRSSVTCLAPSSTSPSA